MIGTKSSLRKLLLLLVCCCLCQLGAICEAAAVQPKIVGGTTTTVQRAPYLVTLLRDGRFNCGGALVGPLHVVTAAHCVSKTKASRIMVVGGSTFLNSNSGVRRKVARKFVPRAFNFRTMNKDVAVLKLSRAMSGPNIQPIPLCASGTWQKGSRISVYGWGAKKESSKSVSNSMRVAQVHVVAQKKCAKKYARTKKLTRTMFCAAREREDACSGDSGGPAVHNGRLCGIISWGRGCARAKFPGVYTKINAVKGFIRQSMKK